MMCRIVAWVACVVASIVFSFVVSSASDSLLPKSLLSAMSGGGGVADPNTTTTATAVVANLSESLAAQLAALEEVKPMKDVLRFAFQSKLSRSTAPRPHTVNFSTALTMFPVPVPRHCKGRIRPDHFCVPNIGRDWKQDDIVFPLSYALPDHFFAKAPPKKDKACADIVPKDKSTYVFRNEREYFNEYSRSYYCITYKKGGWDVLRHYEIIASGCMPFFVDIEYAPEYALYDLPKQLLLEARELPGVSFNCSSIRVAIDFTIFPKERYFELLQSLLDHAQAHLTTAARARFFLKAMGKPNATRVLVIAKYSKTLQLRAQGNYNSWSLFHGLRSILGDGAVDTHKIPFLYAQPPRVQSAMKTKLYGKGFGYAFQLRNIPINRWFIENRTLNREFDLVLFADMGSVTEKRHVQFLPEVLKAYNKTEIAFIHAPDIAYAKPSLQGYSLDIMYKHGVVFQREIPDCEYYAPPNRRSESMKRCIWYHNKNCFDDSNIEELKSFLRVNAFPYDQKV